MPNSATNDVSVADSYAWYSTLKFFENIWGTPYAEAQGRGEEEGDPPPDNKPTKALNILLENRRRGIPDDANFADQMKWLFFSVPQGTASECTENPAAEACAVLTHWKLINPPFPAGTFDLKTQDGACEYKNDGTGNAGSLWCSGTEHGCKAHAHKDTGREDEVSCDELAIKTGWATIYQRAVVVCEW